MVTRRTRKSSPPSTTSSLRKITRDLIRLDPLSTKYSAITKKYPGADGSKALDNLRNKILKTLDLSLDMACERIFKLTGPDPDFRVKLAILPPQRRFVNQQEEPGQVPRPFWGHVDEFYQNKTREFGVSFDTPRWGSYWKETVEMDGSAKPSPSVIEPAEPSLFTTKPLTLASPNSSSSSSSTSGHKRRSRKVERLADDTPAK
ncbi:hypothetical protein DFH07DRAFT_1065909 [Mycena maculata]|uniref:Uncharacterized protein n=1 Tax=Mycena maculata TaxID=230809 RepID=A0AAD7HZI8_9AGAR|nr:hypothetical protein DFH07DRAFT_1065909 [Mycena maculata]